MGFEHVAILQERELADEGGESGVAVEILGPVLSPQTIAVGSSIRELARLHRVYGPGRWRKRKGIARVRLPDGTVCSAELHWYEAHGVGRREFKVKQILGDRP